MVTNRKRFNSTCIPHSLSIELDCDSLKNIMNGTLMTVADDVPLVFTLISAGCILDNNTKGEKYVSPLQISF